MPTKTKLFEEISFNTKEGLKITGDYYKADEPKDFMLLCHRSHFNRGEYRETAPVFTRLGFSCLAIDQRSGMNVSGVINETKKIAEQGGLPTGYLDAKPDIESAIEYVTELNNLRPVIVLGSSYSASLALLIATETDNVKAVLAFSPGEYLKGIDLANRLKNLNKPAFVTSSRDEINQVEDVIRYADKKCITHFKPQEEGSHGSKILWPAVKGYDAVWKEVEKFLQKLD